MKQSIITIVASLSAVAAISTSALASQPDVGNAGSLSIERAWATPLSGEPVVEPEAGSEEELTLRGMPDLENRPER